MGGAPNQSRVKSQRAPLNLLRFPLRELRVWGGTVVLVLKLSYNPTSTALG